MEFKEVITNELLYEIGRNQAPPAIERLRVQKAILVGLSPDQQVVPPRDRQLGLGVLVGRVLERLVAETSNVHVASALARNVEHVHLALGQYRVGRQAVERVCEDAPGNLGHLPRTQEMVPRRAAHGGGS